MREDNTNNPENQEQNSSLEEEQVSHPVREAIPPTQEDNPVEKEEPIALPEESATQASSAKKPRVPLLSADRYTTVALPDESVPINPETHGPAENPNVHVTSAHDVTPPFLFIATPESVQDFNKNMFFLPEQSKELDARISAVARPSAMETLQGRAWTTALEAGHVFSAQVGMVQSPAQWRENSKWEQFVRTEANAFGFTTPSFGEENTPLVDGQRARIRVRALMGNGGVITIPMVRSGFWITLHAPTETAWYELHRRFNDDKIKYGRETAGMIFSNEQVYMNSWLLEFCLDHVYDASVKYSDPEQLRPLINAMDLPILFAGMARLAYPRGFDYVRSITTTEGIQNTQLIKGKLDIAKLLWVDNNYLTAKQKAHMANRTRATATLESLQAYANEFALSGGREVKFKEGLSLVLKTPSADKCVEDGDLWITEITTMVDETFTTARPTVEERNRLISKHASMARMIRYRSWVSSVCFDGAEHTHPDAITQSLITLSEDDGYVEHFEKEIKRFISDATVSMIAIPDTTGLSADNHERFPSLLPLDVVTVFFTLLAQRMSQ